MAGFGKWVGGAIGWALGGPIGGILGYQVGKLFTSGIQMDEEGGRRAYQSQRTTRGGDFAMSLVVLSAAVMNADGKVLKSELNFVKKFLKMNFGEVHADQLILLLKEALKQKVDVRGVADQIRMNMDHPKRMLLLQYLYGIAKADGNVSSAELQKLLEFSNLLKLSTADFESIKAMFIDQVGGAYKILEIDKSASNQKIKKAYRDLAKKHHPDKVQHLGAAYVKAAQEKFQKIQKAYQRIKTERGF